jgi:hypothetical protein
MSAIKMIPSRMELVDENGFATPEFFRVMQAVQQRTGGVDGVIEASDIACTPTGDVAAVNVQAAIAELASEKATSAALSAHISDASDAHDASAISNVPAGGIAATTVQAALNELDTDKEAAGSAASSMTAHLAAGDPHPQYLTAAEGNAAYQPLDSDLTSWAGVTRAAGLDTFVATPSSANLAALLTDETGTGAAVFAGSPALTGTPTAPTAAAATSTTQLATTAFVQAAVTSGTAAYFSAHNNGSAQSIPDSAFTVLTMGTEVYDVGAAFASNAWTPPAGRLVTIKGAVALVTTAGNSLSVAVFKNGTIYKQGALLVPAGTVTLIATVVCDDVPNGTDVYDLRAYQSSGSAQNTAGAAEATYFQGTTVQT